MVEIRELESDALSHFHTNHRILRYGEFTSVEEYLAFQKLARENHWPIYILANGSNTLFVRHTVRTMVLKNKLPAVMHILAENRIEASSSLNISVILKHCQKNGLEAFYYLASVPATVGGAIAMNAGRGRSHNKNIFDFVESVTFIDGDEVVTQSKDEIAHGFRQTIFTGLQDKLIINAVFKFEQTAENNDQIRERIEYSRREQDLSGPNCGSVFKEYDPRILGRLRGFRVGKAAFSAKTINWIINRSPNSRCIRALIWLVKLAHMVIGRRAKLEVIEVE